MPSKRIRLLLLDANVIIKLHELGLWDKVVEWCEVIVAETVKVEADFYFDAGRERCQIELESSITAGKVSQVTVAPADIQALKAEFKPMYLERLDAGEAESLAYLIKLGNGGLICSADSIVWKVLGALRKQELGLSLEEVLAKIGHGRVVEHMYSKKCREEWMQRGFTEGFTGGALQGT